MLMSADTLTAPQRPSFKRRTYLLDRGFQLKYTLVLALVGAASIAFFGALAGWVYTPDEGVPPGGLAPSETWFWLTVTGALGMAAALGLFGLVFTHRVAGPVYVMNLHLTALASGRYLQLRKLRKHDELRHFFDSFSDAVERIRARESEEAQLLARAVALLQPLATTQESLEALGHLASLQARKAQATEPGGSGA